MTLRTLAPILASVILAASAVAAPPKGKTEAAAEAAGEASEKEIARSIELGGLAFPVFDEDRELLNYFFINGRMLAGPGKDIWKYREKGHLIRDAVLRAAHRESFHVKGDPTKFDEARAAAACLKAANAAVGDPDALVTMTFTQIASQVGG